MFKSFYEYYHFLLSSFGPLNRKGIKKLLDDALFWYNQKNEQRFMNEMRNIHAFLLDVGKNQEADQTQNYIQWLIYLSGRK